MPDPDERVAQAVEDLPVYEKPPLIPLPGLDHLEEALASGSYLSPFGQSALRAWLKSAGFERFYRQLPDQLEELLRRINFRGATAYAPQVAASLALSDDPQTNDPLERAARLVLAAHSLCLDIQNGQLPQDRWHGQPLEMGQYPNLFSTCLVLDEGEDRLFKSRRQERIAVFVGGHSFVLNTGAPGCGVSVAQIRQALAEIQETAGMLGDGSQSAPGYLSACSNPTQRRIWRRIHKLPGNATSLQILRHTLFSLCLDLEAHPENASALATQAQVGNPGNRWYHAALQIVVCGNGRAAAIMNFSAGLDGNVMMRSGGELARRARALHPPSEGGEPLGFQRLDWTFPAPGRAIVRAEINSVIDRDQPFTFEIPGLGRTFWQAQRLPAVPVFVCALQLAALRLMRQAQSDPQVAARSAALIRRYFPRNPPPPPGPRPLSILQFISLNHYRGLGLTQADVSSAAVEALAQGLADGQLTQEQAGDLLRKAVQEQRQVIERTRSRLPLPMVLRIFRFTRRGLGRVWTELSLLVLAGLLRLFGQIRHSVRSILISHPSIDPDVPVVGRPGVRLGYLRHFGLHYQIWEERITLTWMPGITWPFSNEETTQALKQALNELAAIASAAMGD